MVPGKTEAELVNMCIIRQFLPISRYYVMGMRRPQFKFVITVTLEQRAYLTVNGSGVWKTVSKLVVGSRQRIAVSDSHMVCCLRLQY